MNGFNIDVIGERINPGFKSTRALFDERDLSGIQALAVKQAEAGARYLNVNIGAQAIADSQWMVRVIEAIQQVVTVPLSFDFPSKNVQEICLACYDAARADGELPIVNSVTEHRWNLLDLYGRFKFKVIVMTSERVDAGQARGNKSAEEIYGTARRAALRLKNDYRMPLDDIFIDMSVSAVVADTGGLNRATVEAIKLIGGDPDLRGVHMMGGLSNIGQQLPPKAADGSDLKHSLENAFLTLTAPHGFDFVLGTPWRNYHPLPEDNYVLRAYSSFLEKTGTDALRAVRKFYRA